MALTDVFVRTARPGDPKAGEKHADGRGLYLHLLGTSKYWRFRYRYLGKEKILALGVYPDVSLAQARQRRDAARKLLAEGRDPMAVRRGEKLERELAAGDTFEFFGRQWLARLAQDRRPSTHKKMRNWLEHEVFPMIGAIPIRELRPRDVLLVARRFEDRGALESAHRIKQLCGQICRYCLAIDVVERDVTRDLHGALRTPKVVSHAALTEPRDVAVLMRRIHGYRGFAPAMAALKLAPLVFVRPGELRTAEWSEFDLDAAEWRIPSRKMKMGVDHVVPLATQAVRILRDLHTVTGHGKWVFPNVRNAHECMSENTINAALRGIGYAHDQMTGHGFRAMARTMLDEILGERVDWIEHQLAHAVRDPNGRAYNRTAHLAGRREMMQRWADYLDRLRLTG